MHTFHSHEMHLLAPFGLLTEMADFQSPFHINEPVKSLPFHSSEPFKGTPFGVMGGGGGGGGGYPPPPPPRL